MFNVFRYVCTMMEMRWCNAQINEYVLQAKTHPTICTYHKLLRNNENEISVFPEFICNKWQNIIFLYHIFIVHKRYIHSAKVTAFFLIRYSHNTWPAALHQFFFSVEILQPPVMTVSCTPEAWVTWPRQYPVQDGSVSIVYITPGKPLAPPWEKTLTLWKIQSLPCDVYAICWREISIWMDFTDRYVLESIFNRLQNIMIRFCVRETSRCASYILLERANWLLQRPPSALCRRITRFHQMNPGGYR